MEVLLNTSVTSVGPTECTLGNGRKLPFGLMVGYAMLPVDAVCCLESSQLAVLGCPQNPATGNTLGSKRLVSSFPLFSSG